MLIASLQQIAYMMDAEQLDAAPILDTGELHNPDPDCATPQYQG